mgnify:CR=1 FL=1
MVIKWQRTVKQSVWPSVNKTNETSHRDCCGGSDIVETVSCSSLSWDTETLKQIEPAIAVVTP